MLKYLLWRYPINQYDHGITKAAFQIIKQAPQRVTEAKARGDLEDDSIAAAATSAAKQVSNLYTHYSLQRDVY